MKLNDIDCGCCY